MRKTPRPPRVPPPAEPPNEPAPTAPDGAKIITGRGVGGDHVDRLVVAWSDDTRPLSVEFDTTLLSPERQAEVWALLDKIACEDPALAQPVRPTVGTRRPVSSSPPTPSAGPAPSRAKGGLQLVR